MAAPVALCGLDCYLALVLICFIQIQISYCSYTRKSVGAHPIHLQICVLLLQRAFTWYMVCGRMCGVFMLYRPVLPSTGDLWQSEECFVRESILGSVALQLWCSRPSCAMAAETWRKGSRHTASQYLAPPSSVATSAIEDAHDIIHPYGLSEDPGIPEKMLAATLLEKSSVTTALQILAACS